MFVENNLQQNRVKVTRYAHNVELPCATQVSATNFSTGWLSVENNNLTEGNQSGK